MSKRTKILVIAFLVMMGTSLYGLLVYAVGPESHGIYARMRSITAIVVVNDIGDASDTNAGDSVCDTGSGACTLRAAIEETNALPGADTINFDDDYTITLGSALPQITDELVIDAESHTVIVDGSGAVRGFNSAAPLTLEGLTVQNGSAPDFGGGLYTTQAITLVNTTFLSNTAPIGGGLYASQGTVRIAGSNFVSNTATNQGGGIYLSSAVTAHINASNIANNQVEALNIVIAAGEMFDGGGISSEAATLNITDTTIVSNAVSISGDNTGAAVDPNVRGGGIAVLSGTTHIARCDIISNSVRIDFVGTQDNSGSHAFGGGVYVAGSSTDILNSTVSGNSTASYYSGSFCDFSYDSVAQGGGVGFASGTLTLKYVSLVNNDADAVCNTNDIRNEGGGLAIISDGWANPGISADPTGVTMTNSVLALNTTNETLGQHAVVADQNCRVEPTGGASGNYEQGAVASCVAAVTLTADAQLLGLTTIGAGRLGHPFQEGSVLQDKIAVGADCGNAANGTHLDVVKHSRPQNSACDVGAYEFTVSTAPAMQVTPTQLNFDAMKGGANPAAQQLGVAAADSSTINWAAATSSSWLDLEPSSGNTPATLTVTVNSAGLLDGTHTSVIIFTSPDTNPSYKLAFVTLTLHPADQPYLAVDPASLDFGAVQSGVAPAVQTFAVQNTGASTLTWQASTSANWLTLTPSSLGTAIPPSLTAPGLVTVTVDSNLSPGTYNATIVISSTEAPNSPMFIDVNFIALVPPTLDIQPSILNYSLDIDAMPETQIVNIDNSGQGSLTWQASSNDAWTSLVASDIQTPGVLSVTVNPANLRAGYYTGSVVISSTEAVNAPQIVALSLQVAPPELLPSSTLLDFAAIQNNAVPAAQVVTVSNTSAFSVAWQANSSAPWLDLVPLSDNVLQVAVNDTFLPVGTYQTSISISSADVSNSPQTINVRYEVQKPAELLVTPTSLQFEASSSGSLPASQKVQVGNLGDVSLTWQASSSVAWLTLTPSGNTAPAELDVVVNTNLAIGTFNATITISSTESINSPQTVNVVLKVSEKPYVFVDDTATGNNNGSSWADAFTDLENALEFARNNPKSVQEIWVAEGTYTPTIATNATFNIPNELVLYGGFIGTESESDQRDLAQKRESILIPVAGQSAQIVLLQNSNRNTIFDGFTIAGNTNMGLYLVDANPTLRNLLIRNNRYGLRGTGDPHISYTTFESNKATVWMNQPAGGMSFEGHPVLDNVTFRDNYGGSGGGLYNKGPITLTNAIFDRNRGWSGGGAMFDQGFKPSSLVNIELDFSKQTYLRNVLFSYNEARFSSGMYVERSIGIFDGLNFVNNKTTYKYSRWQQFSTFKMYHTSFTNIALGYPKGNRNYHGASLNSIEIGDFTPVPSLDNISFSLPIKAWRNRMNVNDTIGNQYHHYFGFKWGDPGYVNFPQRDLHLRATSPYTKGSGSCPMHDADGIVRDPQNCSIGAYQFVGVKVGGSTRQRAAMQAVVSQQVDTREGQVTLQIPQDATSQSIWVVYQNSTVETPPDYAGRSFSWLPYLGDDVLTDLILTKPATITLSYNLSPYLRDRLAKLELTYYNAQTDQWLTDGLQVISHDTNQHTMQVRTWKLGQFALVVPPSYPFVQNVVKGQGNRDYLENGSLVTYTLTVSNPTETAFTDATLNHLLPDEVTFEAWVTQQEAIKVDDGVLWQVDLAGHQTKSIAFTARVNATSTQSTFVSTAILTSGDNRSTATSEFGLNTPIQAVDDDLTIAPNTAVSLYVLNNDDNPDSSPVQLVQVSTPNNGSASIQADNAVLYTPNSDFIGTDSFSYIVQDGQYTSTATVTIRVGNFAFLDAHIDVDVGNTSSDDTTISNGSLVTYTITLINQDLGAPMSNGAENIQASNQLTGLLWLAWVNQAGAVVNDTDISWQVGDLAVGETISLTYVAQVQATINIAEIVNAVIVSADNADTIDAGHILMNADIENLNVFYLPLLFKGSN